MNFHFAVSGSNIRLLLSALACVSRLGDAVNILGLSDGIEISAVSPNHKGHIAVGIHKRCFDRFLFELPSSRRGVGGGDLGSSEVAAKDGADPTSANDPKPHLRLLTKTLVATVLRQHNNSSVQSIDFEHQGAASADTGAATGDDACTEGVSSDGDVWKRGRPEADVVRVHCTYARNLTKTFLLRLVEGEPSSIDVNMSCYRFEVCGNPRAYGGLLGSLPSSANQCELTLPRSGGLELRAVRQGGVSSSSGDTRAIDGSSTVVTAFESTFTLFRFFEPAVSPSTTGAVGVAAQGAFDSSEIPPTALSTTQEKEQLQQPNPQRDASNAPPGFELATTVTSDFALLPKKTFDVKPFKSAACLAEQFGTQLHLLTGEEGVPIIIASITPEEVDQRRLSAYADTAGRRSRSEVADAASRPSLLNKSASSVPAPALVSFVLHLAALDSPHSDGTALEPRDAASGAADTSIATAISSAVNTPRPSTHHRSSKGTGGARTEVTAASASQGYGERELGENDAMPVSSGNSTTSGTLSHVEASFASCSAAASASGREQRPCQENDKCVELAYATPRPTVSQPGIVMVMTGGDTPGPHSTNTDAGDAARISSGFPTGATASYLPSGSPVSMTAATPRPTFSVHTPTSALNSIYPLDFDAFARSYTSANDLDDEAEEEYAQDAELREFLASCVASMSREPAQS